MLIYSSGEHIGSAAVSMRCICSNGVAARDVATQRRASHCPSADRESLSVSMTLYELAGSLVGSGESHVSPATTPPQLRGKVSREAIVVTAMQWALQPSSRWPPADALIVSSPQYLRSLYALVRGTTWSRGGIGAIACVCLCADA